MIKCEVCFKSLAVRFDKKKKCKLNLRTRKRSKNQIHIKKLIMEKKY